MKSWGKFKSVVEKTYPEFVGALNTGATKNELSDFENSINVTLPKEFIDLYTFSNGQNDNVNAYLFGMEFLSLTRVKEAYDAEISVMETWLVKAICVHLTRKIISSVHTLIQNGYQFSVVQVAHTLGSI